jgi:hypothetical protein
MKFMITPYAFEIKPKVTIVLPTGAELLTITGKGRVVTLWAKVDADNPVHGPRYFVCYDICSKVDPLLRLKYVATVQQFTPDAGAEAVHMAHVFEVLLGDGPVQCKDCANCGIVEIPTSFCLITPRNKATYVDHEHAYFKAPFCTKVWAILDLATRRQCGCYSPAKEQQ